MSDELCACGHGREAHVRDHCEECHDWFDLEDTTCHHVYGALASTAHWERRATSEEVHYVPLGHYEVVAWWAKAWGVSEAEAERRMRAVEGE